MKLFTIADAVKAMEPKKARRLQPSQQAIAEEMGEQLIIEWADALNGLRYRSRSKRRIFAQRWMMDLRAPFEAVGGLRHGIAGWWWDVFRGPRPGIVMMLNEKNTILDDIPWL